MSSPRRSVYADRLREFPGTVFSDGAQFSLRGKWREHFRSRIGASFDGRIVFDVGCADASLLAAIAPKHPCAAFVGIDWKPRGLHTGAQHLAGNETKNVALLHGRARDITHIFAEKEIDELWLFHPEPCDNAKELPNRLFAEPFLVDAHRTLSDAGRLVLKTDHAGYYQWALALFGVDQPDQFADVIKGSANAREVRIRRSELVQPSELPGASAALTDRFEVALRTHHYWTDPAALSATATCVFANVTSAYEQRFERKGWPIYYLELRKR
jgi:tRNA (guanine-N7-)-methyltransferase